MTADIQWPRAKYWDKAWNPIIGCQAVSPACEHCWARGWADRFSKDFKPHYSGAKKPPSKGVVFCGNLTDMFGEWVLPCEAVSYIAKAIDASGPRSVFLWLTKRARRMADDLGIVLREFIRKGWLDNHYFGFTAENQQWYDKRISGFRLLKPDWANGWLSAEPLLGPLDLGLRYIPPEDQPFEWVVVGCESGPERRPCKVEWVERVVDECLAARVPVFVKQLDLGGKVVTDIEKFPAHLRIRQVPWATPKQTGEK